LCGDFTHVEIQEWKDGTNLGLDSDGDTFFSRVSQPFADILASHEIRRLAADGVRSFDFEAIQDDLIRRFITGRHVVQLSSISNTSKKNELREPFSYYEVEESRSINDIDIKLLTVGGTDRQIRSETAIEVQLNELQLKQVKLSQNELAEMRLIFHEQTPEQVASTRQFLDILAGYLWQYTLLFSIILKRILEIYYTSLKQILVQMI